MSFIETIEKAAMELDRRWVDKECEVELFPQMSSEMLQSMAAHKSFDVEELAGWLATAPGVPRQPASSFGEPPVVVFVGRRFHIEILFWNDGTTDIHQHAFGGAFQVLQGSSLHTSFAFESRRRINRHLHFGKLESAKPELLRVGDIRPIPAASKMVHSLFHLDRPSVSIVVRSFMASDEPQFNYLAPGIAFNPFYEDTRLPRLIELFTVLFKSGLPERLRVVTRFLEEADLHSSLTVLQELLFVEREDFGVLMNTVTRRHEAARALLPPAMAALRQRKVIIEARHTVHDPEGRFVLGLLLNLDQRSEIVRLIGERFPEHDPHELLESWARRTLPPEALLLT